ncbi:heparinase II/III domain-containing protein [Desulfoluna spongiiphila]|uniref:heparinase II/III domain-containing protein n=1 Tax=Desulfoluna spongiiphila TaxID=419481 RepID=UPI0018696ECD|nr:heparinase II/III family protein [Desulfoluna spongiiphila]
MNIQEIDLSGRCMNLKRNIYFSSIPFDNDDKSCISLDQIKSNGKLQIQKNRLHATFQGGMDSYQIQLFTRKQKYKSNGLAVRLKISEWESINYLAIGFTGKSGKFRHIKVKHPLSDKWFEVLFGEGDLINKIQNGWDIEPFEIIGDIRIYIKGKPKVTSGYIWIETASIWNEIKNDLEVQINKKKTSFLIETQTKVVQDIFNTTSKVVLNIIFDYLARFHVAAASQITSFFLKGTVPLGSGVNLDWNIEDLKPADLKSVGTYSFSWHACHPASMLMLDWWTTGKIGSLFAAREIITNWLNQSYYNPDIDTKFTWYDHGTAERLLSMVIMWSIGLKFNFDYRFMARLLSAIHNHGELLYSEAFYAYHQPIRYHNHAWFQDLALLATGLAIPEIGCTSKWVSKSILRLSDQLDQLIVRDSGYSIFVENSIGYHHGVQLVAELAGKLAEVSDVDNQIPDIAKELISFTDLFRYPDNRSPAQGDTFRMPAYSGNSIRRGKPYPNPQIEILSKAGYGIIKSNHDNVPFMLCMYATSLSKTHKHKDNLHFNLFFDGIEWLIDPSYYSYESSDELSKYFKSSEAHNVVSVTDCDYEIELCDAQLTGSFDDQSFFIDSSHTSYSDCIVKRSIWGDLSRLALHFEDSVISSYNNEKINAYLMLHCGENISVENCENGFYLTSQDSEYALRITLPSANYEVFNGQDKNFHYGNCGLGFRQHICINSVRISFPKEPQEKVLNWSIDAIRIDGNIVEQ